MIRTTEELKWLYIQAVGMVLDIMTTWPNLSPEPIPFGVPQARDSAVASVKPREAMPLYAVHVASRRWLVSTLGVIHPL